MSSQVYDFHIDHSDEFWQCLKCGLPNFASSLFESSSIADSDHSVSNISTDSSCLLSPTVTIQDPIHSSTPSGKSSHPTPSLHSNRAPKQIGRKQNIHHLKIITANCQSVKKKNLGFLTMLSAVKPDIVLGTESWLKSHIKNSEVFPSDYKVYRNDRKRQTGGGVFILVSNKLVSNSLPELQSDSEIIWAQIKQKGKQDLYICSAYRPDRDSSCIDEIHRTASLIDKSSNIIVIGGDLNLGDINWNSLTVDIGATRAEESNKLLELADSFSLQQLIHEPTRITDTTQNILDLLFINNPTLVDNIKVIPGFSDHCIPFIDITSTPRINYKERRKIFLFDKADWEGFKSELVTFGLELKNLSDELSVQELWDKITSKLECLTDKHIPSKVVTGKHHLSWINTEIKKLMKKRDRLYSKVKKGKYKYFDKLKKLKALIQKKTRKAYWDYINNIVCDPTEHKHGTTKRFWSFIKSLKKDSCGVAPLREDGILKSASTDKANILNRQFSSVFTKPDSTELPDLGASPFPDMKNISISKQGVAKLLKGLNPHKAAGPDAIKPRLLKECAEEISPILTLIFTKSLQTGLVPTDWNQANVTPVFKKGEKFKPSNYRPVSLTCIACKLLEHIVVSNTLDHLDINNILVDNQHGFRARRSCETQLVGFVHDLTQSIKRGQVDVAIMDFSKAFDVVDHRRLLYKLKFYGITGPTNNWINAFLSNRKQKVVVDGSISSEATVDSGVPQGSVLGPLLFLLYINDLPACIQSNVRLFADDCIIYREICSANDPETLQEDLKRLEEWEKKWRMTFNVDKCHIMHITKTRKTVKTDYTLHNQSMSVVQQATYLGVEFSSNLSWTPHINKITNKASQNLGFLKRNFHSAKPETKAAAYKSIVRPSLEYSSSVWDPYHSNDIQKLENVQRRAARFVTNNYSKSPGTVTQTLNQLQWESLERRRQNTRLSLFHKIHYGLVDITPSQYMTPYSRSSRHYHPLAYQIPHSPSDYIKYSFFPRTIVEWNSLPVYLVSTDSNPVFKSGLTTLPHIP